MKSRLALIGLCAWAMLSACARESAPAEETPAVVDNTPAEPCDDAPDQRAMTACWGAESRKEEERVAEALKKLDALIVSKTSPAAQQQLQEDQRRWEEFVEGHCGLYGEIYDGGSAGPMTIAVCRWQLAQSRLQQLTDLTVELDR